MLSKRKEVSLVGIDTVQELLDLIPEECRAEATFEPPYRDDYAWTVEWYEVINELN